MRAFLLALGVAVLLASGAAAQTGAAGATGAASEWTYFGGTRAFTRYAPLDQIDRTNVARLRVAWRRPAVDPSLIRPFPELEPSGYLRATPILVDGVLYGSNAVGLVEAFDPGTGETLWLQRPPLPTLQGVAGRGFTAWRSGLTARTGASSRSATGSCTPSTPGPVRRSPGSATAGAST